MAPEPPPVGTGGTGRGIEPEPVLSRVGGGAAGGGGIGPSEVVPGETGAESGAGACAAAVL